MKLEQHELLRDEENNAGRTILQPFSHTNPVNGDEVEIRILDELLELSVNGYVYVFSRTTGEFHGMSLNRRKNLPRG